MDEKQRKLLKELLARDTAVFTADPTKAKAHLVRIGIIDRKGKLTAEYGGDRTRRKGAA